MRFTLFSLNSEYNLLSTFEQNIHIHIDNFRLRKKHLVWFVCFVYETFKLSKWIICFSIEDFDRMHVIGQLSLILKTMDRHFAPQAQIFVIDKTNIYIITLMRSDFGWFFLF